MFAYSVGDAVIANWAYLAGQRGRILKAELIEGAKYYLVALPESDTWLMEESITLV